MSCRLTQSASKLGVGTTRLVACTLSDRLVLLLLTPPPPPPPPRYDSIEEGRRVNPMEIAGSRQTRIHNIYIRVHIHHIHHIHIYTTYTIHIKRSCYPPPRYDSIEEGRLFAPGNLRAVTEHRCCRSVFVRRLFFRVVVCGVVLVVCLCVWPVSLWTWKDHDGFDTASPPLGMIRSRRGGYSPRAICARWRSMRVTLRSSPIGKRTATSCATPEGWCAAPFPPPPWYFRLETPPSTAYGLTRKTWPRAHKKKSTLLWSSSVCNRVAAPVGNGTLFSMIDV